MSPRAAWKSITDPDKPRATSRPPDRTVLPALLFTSGASALVYEVLWARDWSLLYGSTAAGVAVVLASYFTGLALGAAAAAAAGARRRPLAAYGLLQLAVAASVLGYLLLRPALPAVAAGLTHAAGGPMLPGARALLAFAVLVVPSALLGATLPVAAATLPSGATAAAARLYAWNTLGGAAGALAAVAGVRLLGVLGTFVTAIGLDVAVAGVALALGRHRPVAPSLPASPTAAWTGGHPLGAGGVAAAAGFAVLAGEVLWARGLAGVLSNSVYSVAILLAAVLCGIVGGTGLVARRLPGVAAPRTALAGACIALALTMLVSVLALRAVPAASVWLATALRVGGPGGGLAVEGALAFLVVLLPALCSGAVFPLALALAGTAAPGRTTGAILAANTTGAVGGALAAAFVLLPHLGLAGGLSAAAAVALAATAFVATRRGAVACVAGAALLAIAALAAPTMPLARRDGAGGGRLLFYRDGPTATVSVTADARGGKRLRIDGQYSLGGTDGLFLERREAYVPLLLHPAARRFLALGVGTGDTIGAAAAYPDLRIVGVELVAEALEAARLFAMENRHVLSNPGVHLVADDARSFLLSSRDTWDVVLSDLFLPWTAGTAYLYSLDFYRRGRAHLAPGGLYCQWLPLHQLGVGDLEAVTASFAAAFPHVQLWVAYHRARTPLAALVGTERPLRVDAARVPTPPATSALGAALAANGLDDAYDLAALYVGGDDELRAATAGVRPITDDRPRLEFSAPAAYFHQQGLGRATLAWVAARLDPGPGPLDGAPVPAAARAALLAAQLALLAGDGPGELRAYLEALTRAPEVPIVRRSLVAIARTRLAAGDRATAGVIADALARLAPDTPEAAALAQIGLSPPMHSSH